MNMTLFYFNILLMTLLYLLIFKIILFLVYHSYVLGLVRLVLTPFLDTYPGSVECRSARKGNSNWSAGELPMRVVTDEETTECG